MRENDLVRVGEVALLHYEGLLADRRRQTTRFDQEADRIVEELHLVGDPVAWALCREAIETSYGMGVALVVACGLQTTVPHRTT